MPLYGTGYIFSKKFFTGWVTVGIIWIFCSFIGVGLFPIWESRDTLARTIKALFRDLVSRGKTQTIQAQPVEGRKTSGDVTPTEKSPAKEIVTSM